jgi:Spy/CpxP family protein refolding chaperone
MRLLKRPINRYRSWIMKTSSKTMVTALAAAGFALLAGAAYAFPPGGAPCGYDGGPGAMMGGGWGGGPGAMARGGGHGPGPMARGYGPGAGFQPGAGPAANADARLGSLKETLKITDSQQAAWDAFASKAKEQAAAMTTMRTQMAAGAEAAAPDRMIQHTELMKQRTASMEAMGIALKDLYAVLTPEQKVIADQHFGGWRVAQAGPRGGYGPGAGMRGYGPRW